MRRRHKKRLQFLVGALVIFTALSAYRTFVDKRPGPPQTLKTAAATQVAPDAAGAVRPFSVAPPLAEQEPAGGQPAAGPPPVPPSARLQPRSSGAQPDRPREAVGRPNPFAPLVVPQRQFTQLGILQPPSRPGAPPFGIDLPLPPGGGPPPPPGAGMKVGAIVGGIQRVAVIQEGEKILIVGVGDRVGDATVVEILKDKVVMQRGGVTFDLPFVGEGS
jgi:hypothetical protein